MRSRWGLAAAMGAMALSGCGAGDAPEAAPTASPPAIRMAMVGGAGTEAAVTGVGTVALRRETQLGFTSTGRIARLTVDEGDEVRAGQLLAALDTTNVAADVASAGAERERAGAELRRSETLMRQGWITRPRLESARAALLAANARASAAGFQRASATIVAPGRGVVLARLADPGQVVPMGTPVLTVGEVASGYVLRLPLSDRDTARLGVGAPATVTLAGRSLTGQVVEIAGRADRATGTFAVEVALPADPLLRSGQIGEARIVARAKDAGAGGANLRVPPAAIFGARAGEAFVYIVDRAARRVRLRRVAIAEVGDAAVRVTRGVTPGEWVATSRIDRLKDGMAVAPLDAGR